MFFYHNAVSKLAIKNLDFKIFKEKKPNHYVEPSFLDGALTLSRKEV